MQVGLVLGTATATIKHPSLEGERMIVVQLQTGDGGDEGEPVLAFDLLGAGRGDLVMLTSDGEILQERMGRTTPGRWSVMALPDDRTRREERTR